MAIQLLGAALVVDSDGQVCSCENGEFACTRSFSGLDIHFFSLVIAKRAKTAKVYINCWRMTPMPINYDEDGVSNNLKIQL